MCLTKKKNKKIEILLSIKYIVMGLAIKSKILYFWNNIIRNLQRISNNAGETFSLNFHSFNICENNSSNNSVALIVGFYGTFLLIFNI